MTENECLALAYLSKHLGEQIEQVMEIMTDPIVSDHIKDVWDGLQDFVGNAEEIKKSSEIAVRDGTSQIDMFLELLKSTIDMIEDTLGFLQQISEQAHLLAQSRNELTPQINVFMTGVA